MAAAGDYEELIRSRGGIDVQVLGIGANGHLGFNEPGSALTSRTRVKRLSNRTRRDDARFLRGLDDVPTHCVTQGLGTILEARRGCVAEPAVRRRRGQRAPGLIRATWHSASRVGQGLWQEVRPGASSSCHPAVS